MAHLRKQQDAVSRQKVVGYFLTSALAYDRKEKRDKTRQDMKGKEKKRKEKKKHELQVKNRV